MITVARQAGAGTAPEGYDVPVDGRVITATGTASPTILPGGVQPGPGRATQSACRDGPRHPKAQL
jgi:hypothetical protein